MYTIRLKVETDIIDDFVKILKERYELDYQKQTKELSLFCLETSASMPTRMMTIVVVFCTVEPFLHIDIISTGGGSGIFGNSWGVEKSRCTKIANLFIEFCNESGVKGILVKDK